MKRLYIQEVATRDGFQNEKQFVDTDAKIALIDALSACGFGRFGRYHPKLVNIGQGEVTEYET